MTRINLVTALVTASMSLWLTGCGGNSGTGSYNGAIVNPNGQLPAVIVLCQQDLATRLGLSETPKVVESTEIQWPDTSLGYPQPGRAYAMVITPGYRVILEAQGKSYEYHTDKSSTFAVNLQTAS